MILFQTKITTVGMEKYALAMERAINMETISIALAILAVISETTAKTVNKNINRDIF